MGRTFLSLALGRVIKDIGLGRPHVFLPMAWLGAGAGGWGLAQRVGCGGWGWLCACEAMSGAAGGGVRARIGRTPQRFRCVARVCRHRVARAVFFRQPAREGKAAASYKRDAAGGAAGWAELTRRAQEWRAYRRCAVRMIGER